MMPPACPTLTLPAVLLLLGLVVVALAVGVLLGHYEAYRAMQRQSHARVVAILSAEDYDR